MKRTLTLIVILAILAALTGCPKQTPPVVYSVVPEVTNVEQAEISHHDYNWVIFGADSVTIDLITESSFMPHTGQLHEGVQFNDQYWVIPTNLSSDLIYEIRWNGYELTAKDHDGKWLCVDLWGWSTDGETKLAGPNVYGLVYVITDDIDKCQ